MKKLTIWVLPSSMDELLQKKKRIHGKALGFVYSDINSTLKELFTKGKSVTLHDRSLQDLVTEMIKLKRTISIITIGDIFPSRECCHKFKNMS